MSDARYDLNWNTLKNSGKRFVKYNSSNYSKLMNITTQKIWEDLNDYLLRYDSYYSISGRTFVRPNPTAHTVQIECPLDKKVSYIDLANMMDDEAATNPFGNRYIMQLLMRNTKTAGLCKLYKFVKITQEYCYMIQIGDAFALYYALVIEFV